MDPDAKACAEFLKTKYYEYQARLVDSGYKEIPMQPRIPVCDFHEALCEGHFDFATDTIKCLGDQAIAKFALNTLLDYGADRSDDPSVDAVSKDEETSDTLHVTSDGGTQVEPDSRPASLDETQQRYRSRMFASRPGLCTELPLALATFSGNEYLLRTLVKEGLALDITDSKGNNIFHELVRFSEFNTERALEGVENVLNLLPDNELRKQLFFTPNHKRYRPLELAAKKARPEILLKYINIEGVYRHTVHRCLMFRIVHYDVTDYESVSAKVHKSPLYYLTDVDEEELNHFQKCGLLSAEPFNSWIQARFDSEMGMIRLLQWYWLIFYAFSTVHFLTFANGLNEPYVAPCMTSMAGFLLLTEVLHTKSNLREMWHSCKKMFVRGKVPVTFTFSYRAAQLIYCGLILMSVICMGFFCDIVTFVQIIYVLAAFFGVSSVLFFLQLFDGIGHLLILVQKMFYETTLYSTMWAIGCLAFASAFSLLSPKIQQHCDNAELADNTSQSPEQFADWVNSVYETFLLAVAIMPPNDLYFKQLQSPPLALLLYFALVVILGLMMVNFLIAIMSRRAEQINGLKEDIMKLEKLTVVLYLQERKRVKVVQWLFDHCKRLWQKLEKCRCCHRCKCKRKGRKQCRSCCSRFPRFLKNYFAPSRSKLFRCMPDGKVYLEVVEVVRR